MSVPLGMNAKIYYLSTGTRATWGTADGDGVHEGAAPGNLTEMGNAKDVTLTLEKGEADVTTRANNTWRATVGTLKDGSVEFESNWKKTDAGFAKIFNAWLNDTPIAFAVLDGDKAVAGTEGLWADFAVINISRSEPLEEAITATITLKPTESDVAPEWVRVT